jgi:hypothetical protein
MTILEQAEDLRKQAISLLLQERETIDQKLNQLGHNGEPVEIKNRKAKTCGSCGREGHTSRSCPSPSILPP